MTMKNRSRFVICVVAALLVLLTGAVSVSSVPALAEETTTRYKIAHVTDMHIFIENYANIYSRAYIDKAKGTKLLEESQLASEIAFGELMNMEEPPMYVFITGDLTNDGEIAEKLTHPSYDKKKIYQVILDRPVSQEHFDSILSGITLGDGEIKADELEYIDAEDHRKIGIEIHSGKNRIVRRIFESLGYDVKALDRVYFAGLTKKGLKKGEWRYLSEGEANVLKMGAYV